MKVVLISPPFGEHGQKSKGLPIAPPVLEYLAGLTRQVRPDIEVELIDANIEQFDATKIEADLVGITVLTPQAPFAYKTAEELRKRGIPVILGGIHVNALPEEAQCFADSIVLGEVEKIWGEILADVSRRRLKPVYNGGQPVLEKLPRPATDLWNQKYVFGSFFTARGCPFCCSFCSVHRFYGQQTRFRPIGEVVKEVATSQRRLFWGIDDNVWGTQVTRNIELYKEMARNIRFKYWFGSADLVTVEHPRADELLTWARRAGLRAVLVGWESENFEALKEYRALSKQGKKRVDSIKKIRDHGIEVMLFVMVGGRKESLEDYLRVLELCDKLDVSAHPTMVTPFPGTELYEQYKPYFYQDYSWDYFDGNHALFCHDDPLMTKENREKALLWLRAELFTLPRILRRLFRISMSGFPASHFMSWMIQYPQGRAFREVMLERKDLDPAEIKNLLCIQREVPVSG
jgi:radical SAM superfamily enzyme YgiQ (UPF0313 family)